MFTTDNINNNCAICFEKLFGTETIISNCGCIQHKACFERVLDRRCVTCFRSNIQFRRYSSVHYSCDYHEAAHQFIEASTGQDHMQYDEEKIKHLGEVKSIDSLLEFDNDHIKSLVDKLMNMLNQRFADMIKETDQPELKFANDWLKSHTFVKFKFSQLAMWKVLLC